jgi:hypothetical protein
MSATPDQLISPSQTVDTAAMADRLGVTRGECRDSFHSIGATTVYLLGRAGGIISNSRGEGVNVTDTLPEHVLGRPDNVRHFELVRIGGAVLGLARQGEGIKPSDPLAVTQSRRWPGRTRRGTAYLEADPVDLEGDRTIHRVGLEVTWRKSLPGRVFDAARRKLTSGDKG